MAMGYGQHRIQSLDDLERLIPIMHSADRRRVHIEGQSSENVTWKFDPVAGKRMPEYPKGYWEENLNAVVNTTTGKAVQGTGSLYQVLQHKDFFCSVVDLLRQKGFDEIDGYAIEANGGNRWHVRVLFPDVIIEELNAGKNIKVGGEFSNSYDSFFAARGRAYYMRISCFNQMILSNTIPKCAFTRNHIADSPNELLEIATEKAETFVKNLLKSGIEFKRVMSKAMKTEVEFENRAQLDELMIDVFKVKAHAERIADYAWETAYREKPGLPYQINLWDLYNAGTYYSSHEDSLTAAVQDTLLYRSEQRLLKGKIEMPIATAVG